MTFSRRFASRTARWLLYVCKIVMHVKSKRFHSTRTVNFTCIFSIFYLAIDNTLGDYLCLSIKTRNNIVDFEAHEKESQQWFELSFNLFMAPHMTHVNKHLHTLLMFFYKHFLVQKRDLLQKYKVNFQNSFFLITFNLAQLSLNRFCIKCCRSVQITVHVNGCVIFLENQILYFISLAYSLIRLKLNLIIFSTEWF